MYSTKRVCVSVTGILFVYYVILILFELQSPSKESRTEVFKIENPGKGAVISNYGEFAPVEVLSVIFTSPNDRYKFFLERGVAPLGFI